MSDAGADPNSDSSPNENSSEYHPTEAIVSGSSTQKMEPISPPRYKRMKVQENTVQEAKTRKTKCCLII